MGVGVLDCEAEAGFGEDEGAADPYQTVERGKNKGTGARGGLRNKEVELEEPIPPEVDRNVREVRSPPTKQYGHSRIPETQFSEAGERRNSLRSPISKVHRQLLVEIGLDSPNTSQ